MTIEFLLALMGLALAYFALQDPEQRSQLIFRVGLVTWLLVGVAVVTAHVFLFDQVWFALGGPPLFGEFIWGLDEQLVAYSLFLIAVVALFISTVRMPRLAGFRLVSFTRYLQYLIGEGAAIRALIILRAHSASVAQGLTGLSAQSVAPQALRRVLCSKEVCDQALTMNLSGIDRILKANAISEGGMVFSCWLRRAPGEEMLRWLVDLGGDSPSSSSELLLELIADDPVAVTNKALYQPVGDWALQRIRGQVAEARNGGRPPLVCSSIEYRDPDDSIREFLGVIEFYDQIVVQAARKDMKWHMWLYYMAHMAREAEASFKHVPEAGDDSICFEETGVGRLFAALASRCKAWVELSSVLPAGSTHSQPDSWEHSHENDNIPKSAAFAYSQILATVVGSENVPERWKREFIGDQLYLLLRANRLSLEWKRLVIGGIIETLRRLRSSPLTLDQLLCMVEPVARIELKDLMREGRE